MSDANNIYKLYVENAAQPQMAIESDGAQRWRLNGKLHRVDGPAIKHLNGDEAWYQHGKLHRDGGPAASASDGFKAWYQHGKLHRVSAPAMEWPNGSKEWYQHDKWHREDGPAIEFADGRKFWYLNGKHFDSANEWAQMVLKMHNKPNDKRAADDFLNSIYKKQVNALM